MSEQRTELETLGEFGLIKKIKEKFEIKQSTSVKGIGDDAAVIMSNDEMLVSTDMLIEGVHFDLMYSPLKHLGYKAVVVNVSDIYAMNGKPSQVTISIALSNRFSLQAIEEFYEGVKAACDYYQVDLVGGDTTTSMSGLVISVTAIGYQQKDKIVYRSGAKEHDLICVTGDLGAAYLGLQILEREKMVFKANPKSQPDLSGHDYILERQLKPEARKEIIEELEKVEVLPTSMIDVSDGLSSELFHICEQSNVGVVIYDEKIPTDPTVLNTCDELNLDPTTCALNGGEDYELLFTIDQRDHDKVSKIVGVSVIGHVTDAAAGKAIVMRDGTQIELQAQGWNPVKG